MKIYKVIISILVIAIIFFGLSCTPYLLYTSDIPAFKAPENKALIVYIRTLNMPQFSGSGASVPGPFVPGRGMGAPSVSIGGPSIDEEGAECFLYLDGKYVGGTRNLTLTSFAADSGDHIITVKAGFGGKMKLRTKPGYIYYVEEMPFQMGPLGTKVNVQAITEKEAMEKIRDGDYQYTKPNPDRLKDDMDEDEYQEELEDWDDWAEKNPEEAAKELSYEGYPSAQ